MLHEDTVKFLTKWNHKGLSFDGGVSACVCHPARLALLALFRALHSERRVCAFYYGVGWF